MGFFARGIEWPLPASAKKVVTRCPAHSPEDVEVYPARFDTPLPTIKIPLRESDADALLELQPLLDRAYFEAQLKKRK